MKVFVLDADIVSLYLRKDETVVKNVQKAIVEKNIFLVAPMAYYEVKRGLMAVGSKNRLREFEEFCKTFGVGAFEHRVFRVGRLVA